MKNPRRSFTREADEALDLYAQADDLARERLAIELEYKRQQKLAADARSAKKGYASRYTDFEGKQRAY